MLVATPQESLRDHSATVASSVVEWCTHLLPMPGGSDKRLPNHEATYHALETREKIALVPQGRKLSEIVPGYGMNYRRLRPDRPSWTVTATCYSDLIHPTENRLLTARELARLQSFPDWWTFRGPRRGAAGHRLIGHIFAQIGNAVPPLLAYHLGRHILKHVFGNANHVPVVSLFSGAGGLDIGLEAAGFDVRVCVERDRHAVQTLVFNRRLFRGAPQALFSNTVVMGSDIFRTPSDRILRAARLRRGEVGLVVGGAPCQPFSMAGLREGLSDHRGLLIEEYLRIVRDLRPRAFVFENVKGIRSAHEGSALAQFKKYLAGLGYQVAEYLLNAADYGVPQARERVVVVGHMGDGGPLSPPSPTHRAVRAELELFDEGRYPHCTVQDALHDLPPAYEGGEVAKRIAGTIAERQRKQDRVKWLKRRLVFNSSAQETIRVTQARLALAGIEDTSLGDIAASCLKAIGALSNDDVFPSLPEIVEFCVIHHLEDPPEKMRDAYYVMGIRPLVSLKLVQAVECGSDTRYKLTDRASNVA